MENENYYELLKELLLEIYFEDSEIPNLDYGDTNKIITKINEVELSNIMNSAWIQYLGNSVDFDKFKTRFQDQYQSWKKQLNSFENVRNKSEMISFLKTYFQKSYLIGYELNEVTKNDIKSLIDYKKPKISKDFKGSVNNFDNFLIFTNSDLHTTLHIKIDSFRDESFLLTAFFAFWIEDPKDPFSLDMNNINRNYSNLVLASDIMNKLEVNHYKKLNLFDFDKYDIQYNQNTEFLNDWVKSYPHFFITYTKSILNANPGTLIDEIVEDLQKIKPNKQEIKTTVQNPNDWFQNINQEIRIFYQKGKELFLKTSKLLDVGTEKGEEKRNKKKPEKQKEKLSVEDFIFLFNKAMEDDLVQGKSSEEAGFRTFFQLFTEFLNKKERDRKYEYIEPISRGTFYTLVNKNKDDLEAILERNPDKGQGGGDAYRIIRIDGEKHYETETSLEDHISEATKQIREEIHEGLIYYKNLAYRETIELYKEILKHKKDELTKSIEDYLGVLYYLGKSHLKLEEYKDAKDLFEKIYTVDENRIDAGFKLLVCCYNLKEYDQAKKLVISLFEFLTSSLKPYRSFYKKEILYKNELRHLNITSEELHPNLLHRDLFSKYLIMLNRDIRFYDFFSLRPRYDGAWEDYEKQMEDYKESKYFLNLNIHTYRKLVILRLNVQNYILEIYRKKIFNLFIINKKEKEAYLEIQEVIEYLKEKVSNKDLEQSRINDFLQYLIHFSIICYEKEENEVSEYIYRLFPDISEKIRGYKYLFPRNTRFISWYLYLTTIAMKSGIYIWSQREIGKEVNKPDLIIENVIIEFLNIVNLDLEKNLQEDKGKLESFEFPDKASRSYIFNQWQYQIHLGEYGGEDSFKSKIQEYIDYCKNNNLGLYIKTIENLYFKFEKKITLIKEINQKGRHRAVNEIFKLLYPNFDVEQEKDKIDFSKTPERLNFKFLLIQIQNKIFSTRNQDHGELLIEINLFNAKINKEIYKEIVEEIKAPNIIKVDLDHNSIFLTFYKEIMPSRYSMDFGKYLDYFFLDFFAAFELNTDKIVFRYIQEFEERLNEYFKVQFFKEFKNPYFDFELKNHPEDLYYIIIIKKKKVK